MMNEVKSAYIHIPFCEQLCHYCDFTKFFYREDSADEYVEALRKEIEHYIPNRQQMNTIFVGGGTPTALNMRQLEHVLKSVDTAFDVHSAREYTFEANPGDLTLEKAKLLKDYGVDRISLGVQVFDDKLLEAIGRVHRVKHVYESLDLLKQAGFDNISIDLIYALPGQTLEQFGHTVEEALQFDLPHYSSYSLQIEPKTVFYQRYKKGTLKKAPEELEANMYNLLRDEMKAHGREQYEVSNFALPGKESQHNLAYWNNDFYYGLGAGAHGYLPGRRVINIRPLPAYLKQANENGIPVLHEEQIGRKERIEEELFLGLRKKIGVNKANFRNKFGIELTEVYRKPLDLLISKGWLIEDAEHVAMTEDGFLFGNDVFQEFLLEEEPASVSN